MNAGGAWDAAGHLTSEHGLNFDEPLALFVASVLRPATVLELGSGLGMYVDFACRAGLRVAEAVGVEPDGAMHAFPGAVRRTDCARFIAADASTTAGAAALREDLAPSYDVVMSVEVLEHMDMWAHAGVLDLFRDLCATFLVFSASSESNDQGHVAPRPQAEWRALVEARGFRLLPETTAWLRARLPPRNVAHRANVMVFAAPRNRHQRDGPAFLPAADDADALLPSPPVDGGEEARAAALWPGLARAAAEARQRHQ